MEGSVKSNPLEQWYKPSEIAKALGIGYDRVHKWCLNGKLEAIDLNKNEAESKPSYRISQSTLDRFLESKLIRLPEAVRAPRRKPRKHRRYVEPENHSPY